MDDETLTPFVDALSASLIIMILIAISFILQNSIAIDQSARAFVDLQIEEKKYSPVVFAKPLRVDMEKREILYLSNFELTDEEINLIRNDIVQHKTLSIYIESKQSDKKNTANLVRFIAMLNLPQEISVKTRITRSKTIIDHLRWSQ